MRVVGIVAAIILAGCAGPFPEMPADADPPVVRCSDPCEVTVDGAPVWNFEPHAAASPVDPDVRVVATSVFEPLPDPLHTAQRWTYVDISTDGGATWQRQRLPGGLQAGPDHPLGACTAIFDAFVAFEPDGTIVVGGVAEGEPPMPISTGDLVGVSVSWKDIVVARSSDLGRTWSFEAPLYDEHRVSSICQTQLHLADPDCGVAPCIRTLLTSADKPFMAIAHDGRRALSLAPEAQVWIDDGGWQKAPYLDVGCATYSVDLEFFQGTLHAAATCWASSGIAGAYHARLEGNAWNVTTLSASATAYPAIASGSSGLWVVYPERHETSGGGKQDVFVRQSLDGTTWLPPVRIDRAEEAGWAVPTLAVDGQGIAYVAWYHHVPDDGRSEDAVYLVAAVLGNATAPLQISRTPILQQALGLQLGHYMGIAALPQGAMPAWISGAPGDSRLHVANVVATPPP